MIPYVVLAAFGGLAVFVLYRMWLEMKSDSIIAETKLDEDRKKRAEYEKQDAELSQEIRSDQEEWDKLSSRLPGPHDKP